MGARGPAPSPDKERAIARAREIQATRRLSLRDLVEVLAKEGILTNIKVLSEAGLAASNFPLTSAAAPPPAPARSAAPAAVPTARPTPRPGSQTSPLTPPPPERPDGIDADGTPIGIARSMLRGLTDAMAGLDKDSGPYVKLSGEARQVTKLIAALEREAAGDETPEERERRLRREDGETVRAIERYVDQALGEALRSRPDAPHGRCPTCEQALTPEARAALGA